MHHSSEKVDHNSNYGNIFSLWDHVFGTVNARYKECTANADNCILGLDGKAETAEINRHWATALLREGTILPDLARMHRTLGSSMDRWPPEQAGEESTLSRDPAKLK